jgi:hypothetical protein
VPPFFVPSLNCVCDVKLIKFPNLCTNCDCKLCPVCREHLEELDDTNPEHIVLACPVCDYAEEQ